jgi:hypothetical protein
MKLAEYHRGKGHTFRKMKLSQEQHFTFKMPTFFATSKIHSVSSPTNTLRIFLWVLSSYTWAPGTKWQGIHFWVVD